MKGILILGNMLFPDLEKLQINKTEDLVIMIESKDLITHFKYHKHKIILFLAAMREYAQNLKEKGYTIEYKTYEENKLETFTTTLESICSKNSINSLETFTIEDHFFRKELKEFCDLKDISLIQKLSPGFICSLKEFKEYTHSKKRFLMNDFYIWQRKRLTILVDSNLQPIGGEWSYDSENRKKTPKSYTSPKLTPQKPTELTVEVMKMVEKSFSEHPGTADTFYLPTTREDSLKHLNEFFEYRFKDFGVYEDAIDTSSTFLNHSVLSPLINVGLLTPDEVVNKALVYAKENEIPINSLEGFIRQIIGWREFMRGMYHTQKLKGNFLGHKRGFNKDFYSGETDVLPVDDAIKKVEKYAYNHHIERLMILGNFMLLCEIDPDEVYKFFMEYYVDSSDWVMVPNVYSMSQFADGGTFATKPYIGGSNYIKKMSHYKQDSWCDVWDGLYWRFIDRNRELFEKNYRMSMMVTLLDKMDSVKKERLFSAAETFLDKYTELKR
jgi:deoxyribodipyrimidine photolyase-related protein